MTKYQMSLKITEIRITTLLWLLPAFLFTSCISPQANHTTMSKTTDINQFKVQKTEEEWKSLLSPEQYHVLREAGTERPHTGEYNLHFKDGTYRCGACGEALFESSSKFESSCGWPSFDREIEEGKIIERRDTSYGMVRTEVLCGNCGSHLGHVFNDGPTETGVRYCINSLSLHFEKPESADED